MDSEKMILEKLEDIKPELDYIKNHLANIDSVLTDDDIKALNEAEEDFKKGKTVKL